MIKKIKNFCLLLFVIIIGSTGCTYKPKLNAYVPAKQNVIVEEKIIYKDKIVNTGNNINNKENMQKKYKNIKSHYTFKQSKYKNIDSFALVIGINNYKQNTPVEYADLSALAFEELANKTLGIPKENIITLLNDDATSGKTNLIKRYFLD